MRHRYRKNSGAALLVVLFIVMAITILSLGFLAKSNVELACGENMIMRSQMDYLAESGLEHAKGLILNPQDVSTKYFTGALNQQLIAGSNDYYGVSVGKSGNCDYSITSTANRWTGSDWIGQSSFQAELRLDPYIAYWQGQRWAIPAQVTINGDVYFDDDLENYGTINGDAFCAQEITNYSPGIITGKTNNFVSSAPVSFPGLDTADYTPQYFYNGSGPYNIVTLADNYDGIFPAPGLNNPARVYYRDGHLNLEGNIEINGTLVVRDDLTLDTGAFVTITPRKNRSALIVGYDLKMLSINNVLRINGLAQIGHHIDMGDKADCSVTVLGALCILGDGIHNTTGTTLVITPMIENAAIEIWSSDSSHATRWSPAADAFFRSMRRN